MINKKEFKTIGFIFILVLTFAAGTLLERYNPNKPASTTITKEIVQCEPNEEAEEQVIEDGGIACSCVLLNRAKLSELNENGNFIMRMNLD